MMLTFISPQAVNLQPGDVNRLILRVIEELQRKFKAPAFSVKVRLDPDLGLIPLDENLFEQALMNLMENAWDRMGQKGELELITHKNGETATITLTFPVAYITPDDIEHYFYPFTVDYSSAKNSPVSDPPDVSISKVIIHKHGGTINVTQEDDHRLKLIITLPLR